jgi:hypothetical protein
MLQGELCSVFLWRPSEQSGFLPAMHCDHKPMVWRKRLDFVSGWSWTIVVDERSRKRNISTSRTASFPNQIMGRLGIQKFRASKVHKWYGITDASRSKPSTGQQERAF